MTASCARLTLAAGILALSLGACETHNGTPQMVSGEAPTSARDALSAYYATIPESALPVAPAGRSLPAPDAVITRVIIGSCHDEESDDPMLAQAATEEADLFLMLGDNVYGDSDAKRRYISNDPDLAELREAFADLAAQPEFLAMRAAMPMLVAWDDHDYGANDAGAEFPFKDFAERINETFWDDAVGDAATREGLYHAHTFGPEGQRTQVIVLDTRFFRSALTPTDDYGAPGKERYIPAPTDDPQTMLGDAQWAWLGDQLRQPADVRLIASSIQVLTTDGHGYEHWNNLPAERQRLFDLIAETEANGVVFLSGDRHAAFLYEDMENGPYPLRELTASSLNRSFREVTEERDRNQIGDGIALPNYGSVSINWDRRIVTIGMTDPDGGAEYSFPIDSLTAQ